jgi:hypothetical protein
LNDSSKQILELTKTETLKRKRNDEEKEKIKESRIVE